MIFPKLIASIGRCILALRNKKNSLHTTLLIPIKEIVKPELTLLRMLHTIGVVAGTI